MPPANELLGTMFQDINWTHRQAALLAVSAMAEGCNREMAVLLPSIVRCGAAHAPARRVRSRRSPRPPARIHAAPALAPSRIVQFANDPHPRVRYALCNCIGQLCYDFVVRRRAAPRDHAEPALTRGGTVCFARDPSPSSNASTRTRSSRAC